MNPAFKLLLAAGISTLALTATPAFAEDEAPAAEQQRDEQEIEKSNEIVVQGEIGYRNRSESTEPVLVYDTDYFQRFEPLTAGDALKRVPSVTFLSDVIESDGARLRGLDPGYTQILINGDKVPGGNADRSFFLDRIPAELIKQVEIVRSSSARRSGDAVAGTLNIVLRDGFQLDGGYVRVGGLHFDDGEIKPSVGAVWGGKAGPGRLLVGASVQGRYNPKVKNSLRYASPGGAFVNREDQTDTRDGTDYAFNATYGLSGETTDFELSGFYVRTDRLENERSFEYNKPTGVAGPVPGTSNANTPLGLLSDNANVDDIEIRSYSLAAKLKKEWAAGETKIKAGYSRFSDHRDETEFDLDFNRGTPRFTGDLTLTRIYDEEISFGLEHKIDAGEKLDVVIGALWQNKDRGSDISTVRDRRTLTNALRTWDQFSQDPTSLSQPFAPTIAVPGGRNLIEENRRDGFALVEGSSGIVAFEVGVRYEHTDLAITEPTATTAVTRRSDYDALLPSASLKIDLTGSDRITLSGARTLRRPRLDYLSPALLEAELGDNDFRGNPLLKPEKAWGADAGFEHRIGTTGVVGVNFFYRSITDLIEIANTGIQGSEYEPPVIGPGGVVTDPGHPAFVLEPRNTGDGEVYGVEFDLSTDLRFVGLKDTGVFGNFSYLESDIRDQFGARRFNDQSKYVFNVGAIQNIPSIGGAFGVTYRKQGAAFGRIVGEEVRTSYGADLEVFVEKRFGNWLTIRAVGSNLLDGRKDEVFDKFTTIDEQLSRLPADYDEYELETEKAGPVFQLMARLAF